MLSLAPAKHIKAKNIGEIKVGYNADLVIVNNALEIINVIKGGTIHN